MIDENDVKTRHKNLLKKIRKEHTDDERSNGHIGAGYEEVRVAEQEYSGAERNPRFDQRQRGGESQGPGGNLEGVDRQAGTRGGSDSGIGSAHATDLYTAQSDDPVIREVGAEPIESPSPWELEREETPEEKELRQRELARQRKQRQRERERIEQASPSSSSHATFRDTGHDSQQRDGHAPVTFRLKNIFKSDEKAEPDKPLLAKEADDEVRKKLIDLYIRGSSILDDVLEILVRDHEPVQIWELSEAESEMLVDMQLERARKSAAEARVVRKLVAIYDRLFFALLIGPRAKATISHIDRHGGVSFR